MKPRWSSAVTASAWSLDTGSPTPAQGLFLANSFLGGAASDDPETPWVNEATGEVTITLPMELGGLDYAGTDLLEVTTNGELEIVVALSASPTVTLASLDVLWIEYAVSSAPGDDDSAPGDDDSALGDEDSDANTFVLNIGIPAGGYVILADNPVTVDDLPPSAHHSRA